MKPVQATAAALFSFRNDLIKINCQQQIVMNYAEFCEQKEVVR